MQNKGKTDSFICVPNRIVELPADRKLRQLRNFIYFKYCRVHQHHSQDVISQAENKIIIIFPILISKFPLQDLCVLIIEGPQVFTPLRKLSDGFTIWHLYSCIRPLVPIQMKKQ